MATPEPQFHGTPRFRIVSRIGVGGVGELYKAMDEVRGTFVALRTLRKVPREASDSLQQDFLALKAVRNPSLVALGELDSVDGLWFYTMEFVEGVELLDYVRPRTGPKHHGPAGAGELSELRLRSALAQLVRAVRPSPRRRTHGHRARSHPAPAGRLVCSSARSPSRGPRHEPRLLSTLPYLGPSGSRTAASPPPTVSVGACSIIRTALPFSRGREPGRQKHKGPRAAPHPARDLASVRESCDDPDARPDYAEIRERLGIANESEPRVSQTWSLISDAAPFIGRKRDLGLLAEAFERTRHGAVSALCLYGEAGLGKRTLATQLARKLRNEYPHLVHLPRRA